MRASESANPDVLWTRRKDVRRLIEWAWQQGRDGEDFAAWVCKMARESMLRGVKEDSLDAWLPWAALFIRHGKHRDALALMHDYFAASKFHAIPPPRRDAMRLPPDYARLSFRAIVLLVYLEASVNGNIDNVIPLLRSLPMSGERTACWLARDGAARDFLQREGMVPRDTLQLVTEHYRLIDVTLRLLRPAELALGLSRTPTEVGREPLAKLMGALLVRPESETSTTHGELPHELCRALLAATDPRNDAAWLWVDGLEKPRGWKPPTGLDAAPRPDVGESTWSVLLRGFITIGRQETAAQVWAHIHHLGIEPSAHLWNSLLTGYSAAGRWDAMMQAWQELKRLDRADAYCYTTVINGLFRRGDVEAGVGLFEELRVRAAQQSQRFVVSTETYNAVLNGLYRARHDQHAQHLLNLMKSPDRHASVPAPNTGTWNTLLRHQARQGDIDALQATLVEAGSRPEHPFTPDIVTFVTVIDATVRHRGGSSSALRVVRGLMKQYNVKLNTIGWSSLIKGALRCNLEDEGRDNDEDPAAMLASESKGAAEDFSPLDVRTRQVVAGMGMLNEMLAAGMEPNSITLTSLIHAAFRLQTHLDAVQPSRQELAAIGRELLEAPECEDTLPHLVPIVHLKETPEALEAVKEHRPAAALAMALLQRMQAPVTMAAPNAAALGSAMRRRAPDSGFGFELQGRKTFHVVLAGLLGPNQGQQSPAWRTTLARGMLHLDALTLHSDSPARLTPLVAASSSSPRTSTRNPTSANDVSYRVVLLALLRRLDAAPQGDGLQTPPERRLVLAVLDQVLQRLRHASRPNQAGRGWTGSTTVTGVEGGFVVSPALEEIWKRARGALKAGGFQASG